MGKRKNKHPKLKPHMEGEYLQEVIVTRIPAGTPDSVARPVLEKAHQMARALSKSREWYWVNYYKRFNGDSWS